MTDEAVTRRNQGSTRDESDCRLARIERSGSTIRGVFPLRSALTAEIVKEVVGMSRDIESRIL